MARRPERDFSQPQCQPFFLPGDRHGVLLIHGFSGSAAHMRPLGDGLHARGFTVQGINLPGHATHMADMTNYSWQDWLDSAKDAFLSLKARCDHISVAGLSMGGNLTLLLAEQMQPTACAPISAPMAAKNRLLPLAGLAHRFVPTVMWQNNPQRNAMLDDEYNYGYPGFPTRSGVDLQKLITLSRRNLHAIRCPILCVQSHADESIVPDSANVILQGVSSERKGVLWLDEVPHVCTISREKDNIVNALAEHFRRAEQAE